MSNAAHFFWSVAVVLVIASISGAIAASHIWGKPAQPANIIDIVKACTYSESMRSSEICTRVVKIYEESNLGGRRRDAGQQ